MPYRAVAHVVPHDVNDIGPLAELGLQFGQPGLDLDVLGLPPLAVLLPEPQELRLVDDPVRWDHPLCRCGTRRACS